MKTPKQKVFKHKIGSIYLLSEKTKPCDFAEHFMLCQIDAFTYCLISLECGNRWRNPVEIDMTEFKCGALTTKAFHKLYNPKIHKAKLELGKLKLV